MRTAIVAKLPHPAIATRVRPNAALTASIPPLAASLAKCCPKDIASTGPGVISTLIIELLI